MGKTQVIRGVFDSEHAAARAVGALRIAGFEPNREIHIVAARRVGQEGVQRVGGAGQVGEARLHRSFGAALGAVGVTLSPVELGSAPIDWFASVPAVRATWLNVLMGLGVWYKEAEAADEGEKCVFWVGVRSSETGLEAVRAILGEAGSAPTRSNSRVPRA
ncbi:MAG: hypothetical protein ACR2QM_16460 [Longimicrobiales bacterium]